MISWRLEQVWRDDGTAPSAVPPDLAPATVPNTAMIFGPELFQRHLRLDNTDDILWLRQHLPAVIQSVEEKLSRTLIRTRWRYFANGFESRIQLPRPPIISVDEVAYQQAGVWTPIALGLGGYETSVGGLWGADVAPYGDGCWPMADTALDQVRITYTAGWPTAAQLPPAYQTYIAAMIGTLYENRETMIADMSLLYVPDIERLLVDRVVECG
jgi:hypothetical protein